MIQQNDEQNYNINVFSPQPIEEHKSIEVCSLMTGSVSMRTDKTNKTNRSPYSAFRNSEKEEQKCKTPDRRNKRINNVVKSSFAIKNSKREESLPDQSSEDYQPEQVDKNFIQITESVTQDIP